MKPACCRRLLARGVWLSLLGFAYPAVLKILDSLSFDIVPGMVVMLLDVGYFVTLAGFLLATVACVLNKRLELPDVLLFMVALTCIFVDLAIVPGMRGRPLARQMRAHSEATGAQRIVMQAQTQSQPAGRGAASGPSEP